MERSLSDKVMDQLIEIRDEAKPFLQDSFNAIPGETKEDKQILLGIAGSAAFVILATSLLLRK